MAFIAPLLLLGTLAVAVPIVIHLFGRRRAKTVKFAAIDFLFQSDHQETYHGNWEICTTSRCIRKSNREC